MALALLALAPPALAHHALGAPHSLVARQLAAQPAVRASHTSSLVRLVMSDATPPLEKGTETESSAPVAPPPVEQPQRSKQYDVRKLQGDKSAGGGAGFNQFDPILTLSGFISRRFGILGGLAVVALLASTEGAEILKSLNDKGPVAATGEMVTTASGLQYIDILVGLNGDTPRPGAVVGFQAKVSIGDKVLYDTATDKPVAFKVGQRPFQNILCEGVEEGLKGMRVGSKRKLFVPAALAPKGVNLPPGVPLVYEIEVTEVLPGYF